MPNQSNTKISNKGFTLIEIAVVLVIIGIILSGVVGSFTSSMDSSKIRETRQTLEEIKEALLGFAMINARLPCPVLASSTDGEEDPFGGTTCSSQHGYIPTADLGLKGAVSDKNILLDAWGNPIRYSIYSGPNDEFTKTDGLMSATPPTPPPILLPPYSFLTVNDLNTSCTPKLISRAVVAIVYSTGKNGKNTVSYSIPENENTDADNIFVLTKAKGIAHTCGNYDDVIEWISVNTLYSKLVSAGKLP